MDYVNCAALGMRLPRLGFGAMRLPLIKDASGNEVIDYDQVEKMVDYAMEHGVNYFDTAYGYLNGKSETTLRAALTSRYPRESFILVDKMPLWCVDTPADLERIFNEQLEKCGVDYFDLYYVHSMDSSRLEKVVDFKVFDFLKRKKEEGHIRHIGFSFHDTPEFFEKFVDMYDWEVVQVQLNYLDWDVQRGKILYEKIAERGIPAIIMEPVRGGLLATLPEEIASPFKEIAPNRSQASFALRWMAQYPSACVILSGMSNMQQLEDNVQTFSPYNPLSAKENQAIDEVRRRLLERFEIPCTGCRYCMPCPAGVDIPGQFSNYNKYNLTKDVNNYLKWYNNAKEKGNGPDQCVACGACADKCPQHIEIPQRIRFILENAQKLDME